MQIITVYSRLVRTLLLGDTSSQSKIAIFGHLGLRNPWTVKIWHGWLCSARDPTCKNWLKKHHTTSDAQTKVFDDGDMCL